MGIIRLVLALIVVIEHWKGGSDYVKYFIPAKFAVESFYIISGFYMTMILNEKYHENIKLFYKNRLLRLYPVYWVSTLIIFIYLLFTPYLGFNDLHYNAYKNVLINADTFDHIVVNAFIFINTFIIGHDWTKFIGIDFINNTINITKNWGGYNPSTSSFMINVPAWTISLELTFYLIAPYIVRQKTNLVFLFILFSLIIRYILYLNGYYQDPFSYRFFPSELVFFLLGTLAYKIYKSEWFNKIKGNSNLTIIPYLSCILLILIYKLIPKNNSYFIPLFFLIFFVAIPFIFEYFKKNKFDRFIGELSYPVYISHWLFIIIGKNLDLPRNSDKIALVICLLTLLLSYLLFEFIGKRIDNVRLKNLKKLK